MNLHKIVAGSIANINPFLKGYLGKNQGYVTSDDGTRTPIITYYPASIQSQAATEEMLRFAESQGIQSTLRSVYLYGNWSGKQRPDQFGGDLVQFDNKDWMVIQVIEHWPDWTHVLVALHNNVTTSEARILDNINLSTVDANIPAPQVINAEGSIYSVVLTEIDTFFPIEINDTGIGSINAINLTAVNGGAITDGSVLGVVDSVSITEVNATVSIESFVTGTGNVDDVSISAIAGTSSSSQIVVSKIGSFSIPTSTLPFKVFGYQNYLYVMDYSGSKMHIIDRTDKENLVWVTSVTTAANPNDCARFGTDLYVVCFGGSSNLQKFSLSNPALPNLVSTTGLGGTSRAIAINNSSGHAYVLNDSLNAIIIYDINGSAPTNLGSVSSLDLALAPVISGNYLYLSGNNISAGLQIFDITTPSSPSLVGSLSYGVGARGMAVNGNYAYTANNNREYMAVDVFNKTSPFIATQINSTLTQHQGLTRIENHIFNTKTSGEFFWYDIADPINPVLGGRISIGFNDIRDMYGDDGEYMYASSGASKNLTIFRRQVVTL